MIIITDKVQCCGCAACANVCPKNCIEMKEDNEGFLYPQVDMEVCVNCSLCERVCPIINSEKEEKNTNQIGAIVASKNAEVLTQSTSGGAFTAIAEYVIHNGGTVFGVEMDSDFHVQHVEVHDIEDLRKFRNSKYVQSYIGRTYARVKELLQNDVMVCFSGTPCQIEGLRHYLRRDYCNLLLVDVVCRAVPSPGVWEKYVAYLKKQYGVIDSIRFRDKGLGYQYSTMLIQSKGGMFSRNGIESDPWLRMFFSGMIIRPSCTNCHFRKRYRNSDITIWDCFNVSDLSNSFDETKGATRMLIHSEKGKQIFEKIKDQYNYEMVHPDVLVSGLTELSKSPQENTRKEEFFNDYDKLPMQELLNKYFPYTIIIKMKKYGRIVLNNMGLDLLVKKVKRKIGR